MARHSILHACVTRSPRRRRRGRESLPTATGGRDERHTTQVQNVVKILGLRFGTKYTAENIKTLRYGHLMIMTDQDHDGRCLGVVSRRPVVLRRLHTVDARRLRERRPWVVDFSILRPFGPRRETAPRDRDAPRRSTARA